MKINYKIIITVLVLLITAKSVRLESKKINDLDSYSKIWKNNSSFQSIYPWILKTNERTSIHEAGHVVVGKALNIVIKKVSINENSNSYGQTHYSTYNESAKIKFYLAGYLAELAILKKASYGCDNDLSNTVKKIISFHKLNDKDEIKINEKITEYLEETSKIVLENLKIISRFSEELLNKKELSQLEIDSIFSEEVLKEKEIEKATK